MIDDRQPYELPDLDSIEELNYISTIEEDEVIDRHIQTLREWGYGSIMHVNDLHQLFWEFTRRGMVLDKLFRVAVVECIDEEPLYTRFLGMARRYNGWAQRQIDQDSRLRKSSNRELAEKTAQIHDLNESLKIANARIARLERERDDLVKAQKPKKPTVIENELRRELKKEYNKKLTGQRQRSKSYKALARFVLIGLMNPCSRFFESFDLTREKDVDEYVELFKIASRKVNAPTQKLVIEQYGGEEAIPYFITRVREYNEFWEQNHQEDEDDDMAE